MNNPSHFENQAHDETVKSMREMLNADANTALLTRITTEIPKAIGKKYGLDDKGELEALHKLDRKTFGPAPAVGHIDTVQIRELAEYRDFTAELNTRHAIMMAVRKLKYFGADRLGGRQGIRRCNEAFEYPEGRALMLIDTDMDLARILGFGSGLNADDCTADAFNWRCVDDVLYDILGGGFGALYRSSASSRIFKGDTLKSTKAGIHTAIMVDDGRKIPGFARWLHWQQIERGFCYVPKYMNGTFAVYSFVDTAIYDAADLVFESGPELLDGLEWRPEVELMDGEALAIGKRTMSRDALKKRIDAALDDDASVVAQLYDATKETRDTLHTEHRKETVRRMVKRGADRKEATRQYDIMADGGRLDMDVQFMTADGKIFTVAEAYENPDKWDGALLRCVEDWTYNGGQQTAILYMNEGINPYIVDQAHGRKTYQFAQERSGFERLADTRKDGETKEKKPVGTEFHLGGGMFALNIRSVEDALIDGEYDLYERGGEMVRPVSQTIKDSKGREITLPLFVPVTPHYMKVFIGERFRFTKLNEKGKVIPADPSIEFSKALLHQRGDWPYRVIRSILNAPTIRADGSIVDRQGYDEATGVFMTADMPLDIPAKPTRQDAIEAVEVLCKALREFPFVSDSGRSVVLSLFITPMVRHLFPVAPFHLMSAPAPGTGKSYALDLAAAIAIGDRCPAMSAGRNDEELEKKLGAAMMAGYPVLNLDNIDIELGSEALCQAIERPVVEARILGQSKIFRFENNWTCAGSGNNVPIRDDMCRRSIVAHFDAEMERPYERAFEGRPFDAIMRNRAKYVGACLTIVRAYMLAGFPDTGVTPLASFEGWSDLVRSSLLWVDLADPCATMADISASDSSAQSLAEFLQAMAKTFGTGQDRAVTTQQIINRSELVEGLKSTVMIFAKGGAVSSVGFGKWMKKKIDRICGGFVLRTSYDAHKKMALWHVERIEDAE